MRRSTGRRAEKRQHANRECTATADDWAELSGALCFQSVVLGLRSQPLLTFRKGLPPFEATERYSESLSLCADSTSANRKTEKGYEEGCARGAISICGISADTQVYSRCRELELPAFRLFRLGRKDLQRLAR